MLRTASKERHLNKSGVSTASRNLCVKGASVHSECSPHSGLKILSEACSLKFQTSIWALDICADRPWEETFIRCFMLLPRWIPTQKKNRSLSSRKFRSKTPCVFTTAQFLLFSWSPGENKWDVSTASSQNTAIFVGGAGYCATTSSATVFLAAAENVRTEYLYWFQWHVTF